MAVNADINYVRYSDGVLTVSLQSPTAIGGWALDFRINRRFGSQSGLYQAYSASGYSAVSGITIDNSGQGVFSVSIPAWALSGQEPGAYAYAARRTDSGFATVISQGFLTTAPSIGATISG